MAIVNIQKFADTPISAAAMSDLSRVRSPEARALDFPWDITSPEGIIAFFGAKMHDKNAELKSLMQGQEARNAVVKDVKLITDILERYDGDNKMQPGSADYVEFQRLAAEIKPSLGSSADAKSVQAAIDAAMTPGPVDQTFAAKDLGLARDFAASHGGGTIEMTGPDTVVAHGNSAPVPLDAGTCKDIKNKLQAIADSYSTDNQLDTIRVQDLVNQISQITSLASNIVHSFNDAAMGPIGNIK